MLGGLGLLGIAARLIRRPEPQPARDGLTAAQRAFKRFPHLRPAGDSEADLDVWLAQLGVMIADDDEYADLYLTLAELDGRPLPLFVEPVAESPPLPANDIQAIAESVPRLPVPFLPVRKELEALQAAEAFVEWVRSNGRCGTYSSQGLSDLYTEHCTALGFVELPIKVFRPALKKCRGVKRAMEDKKLAQRYGRDRRHRPTQWTILPLKSPAKSEDVPWPELPLKKAA